MEGVRQRKREERAAAKRRADSTDGSMSSVRAIIRLYVRYLCIVSLTALVHSKGRRNERRPPRSDERSPPGAGNPRPTREYAAAEGGAPAAAPHTGTRPLKRIMGGIGGTLKFGARTSARLSVGLVSSLTTGVGFGLKASDVLLIRLPRRLFKTISIASGKTADSRKERVKRPSLARRTSPRAEGSAPTRGEGSESFPSPVYNGIAADVDAYRARLQSPRDGDGFGASAYHGYPTAGYAITPIIQEDHLAFQPPPPMPMPLASPPQPPQPPQAMAAEARRRWENVAPKNEPTIGGRASSELCEAPVTPPVADTVSAKADGYLNGNGIPNGHGKGYESDSSSVDEIIEVQESGCPMRDATEIERAPSAWRMETEEAAASGETESVDDSDVDEAVLTAGARMFINSIFSDSVDGETKHANTSVSDDSSSTKAEMYPCVSSYSTNYNSVESDRCDEDDAVSGGDDDVVIGQCTPDREKAKGGVEGAGADRGDFYRRFFGARSFAGEELDLRESAASIVEAMDESWGVSPPRRRQPLSRAPADEAGR